MTTSSNNAVIVAIPSADDPVWQISSEKVPHLTICFLGPVDQVQNLDQITEYLGHAASISLTRFYLNVDKRGTLGPDNADVLFFDEGWDSDELDQFRHYLLMDDNIRTALDSSDQYDEFTPHLTLGYPAKPAAKLEQGRQIWDVKFDRIALWTGDYSGPEFELGRYSPEAFAMNDPVVDFLAHHGIKGMKWGFRKGGDGTPPAATPVSIRTGTDRKGKAAISADGGHHHTPHEDAVRAAHANQILKASGPHALGNHDLRAIADRAELEQRVQRAVNPKSQKGEGQKFLEGELKKHGSQAVAREVTKRFAKAAVKTAVAA